MPPQQPDESTVVHPARPPSAVTLSPPRDGEGPQETEWHLAGTALQMQTSRPLASATTTGHCSTRPKRKTPRSTRGHPASDSTKIGSRPLTPCAFPHAGEAIAGEVRRVPVPWPRVAAAERQSVAAKPRPRTHTSAFSRTSGLPGDRMYPSASPPPKATTITSAQRRRRIALSSSQTHE
ncbi:hypothetical protein NKDENANG_00720 [Candidatus Entotheonellaceae bacterium PAL068K]